MGLTCAAYNLVALTTMSPANNVAMLPRRSWLDARHVRHCNSDSVERVSIAVITIIAVIIIAPSLYPQ